MGGHRLVQWEGLDGEGLDSGSFEFKPLHDSCPGLARLLGQFYLKQKNWNFWILMRSRLQGAKLDLRGLERPSTGQDEWVWDCKIYPAYSYLIHGNRHGRRTCVHEPRVPGCSGEGMKKARPDHQLFGIDIFNCTMCRARILCTSSYSASFQVHIRHA